MSSPARYGFRQVDVFGAEGLEGNPLAVVHDADDLDTEQMQRFARWTDLSETTFLLAPTIPEADYRVRIFTPSRELPFAGHPTLGTAHAWLEAGGEVRDGATIVQECGAGPVPIRTLDGHLAFVAPPLVRDGPLTSVERAAVIDALDLDDEDVVDAAWVDNGPGWAAVLLRDADAVRAVAAPGSVPQSWSQAMPDALDLGVVGPCGPTEPGTIEVRAFFSDAAGVVREDPVTGSLQASVAQWLVVSGRLRTPYIATQGGAVGADGRVHVDQDAEGRFWIGGHVTTVVEGTVTL